MLNYSKQAGQIALLTAVIADPTGAVPEVKHALLQLANKRDPTKRPVIVEGRLFASIIAAAHWLHFGSPAYWVKAEEEKHTDLPRVMKNLQSMIRNRCDAADYEWSDGSLGRDGISWGDHDDPWMWCEDQYIDEGLATYGIHTDMRAYKAS